MYEQYIRPELLALVPVLNLLGMLLKRSPLDNKHIPMLLGAVAIVVCVLIDLDNIVNSVVQGILIAATSVYAHQLIVQETDNPR